MSITGIITATVLVGALGLLLGLFLGVAAIKFKVEVNEKEEQILNTLPEITAEAAASRLFRTGCSDCQGRGSGECLSGRR